MTQLAAHLAETVPLMDILRHPWFQDGYIEAAQGLPSHFGAYKQTSERDRWFYERGRQVASEARCSHGRVPPLWCGADAERLINPQIIALAGAMLLTGGFA